MKLLRFGPPGQEKPGLLDNDGNIRDLSGVIPDITGEFLSMESREKLARVPATTLPSVEHDVRYGPCVDGVGKFICIGLNYRDHAEETGAPIPEEPVVFSKFTSAISGPNDDIEKPIDSSKLDWEVELGLVIGERVKYASLEEAKAAIAGYCVINDVSERGFQLDKAGQWDLGKGCDTFGPIGPYLVTAEAIADPMNLNMWLCVNGERRQFSNSNQMIFSPAFIVQYLSQHMSLQPGDVVSTGTPPGVGLGFNPPVYLDEGDIVTLGIEGLGEQRQVVVAA